MDRISQYAPSQAAGVSGCVERLRRDVSLSSTAAQYGCKLTRSGQEFSACCPFHAEDTPSFTIFAGQDGIERFQCFGCGRKGDVLDLVQEVRGVDLQGAIRILGGRDDIRPNVPARHVQAGNIYEGLVPLPPPAGLLQAGRRITLYNPKRRGTPSEWGTFAPSMVFPYRKADGSLSGYVLRRDLPDGGKETPMVMFVRLPDGKETWSRFPFPKPRPLYGLETIGDGKQVVIVEGEKCRDRLSQASGRTVVSWPGGTQGAKHTDWSPLSGRHVLIWPDFDGPGLAAADDIAARLTAVGAHVQCVAFTDAAHGSDIERYRFDDWRAGRFPRRGWDSADAVDAGWTQSQLDAFMSATLRDWRPEPLAEMPAAEMEPVSEMEERRVVQFNRTISVQASISARPEPVPDAFAQDPYAFEGPDAFVQDDEPTRAITPAGDAPRNFGRLMGIARFDIELEQWLVDRQWFIKLNLLSGELEIHRDSGIVPMSDARLAEIRFELARAARGRESSKDNIVDALVLIGERRAYHPVHDYLARVKWDGKPRIDTWLVDYFGAEDSALNRAFGRKILCAAVRRVRHPGCKFDHMLVVEGPQDIGKSSAVLALCHDGDWFTDQLEIGADAKVTIEKTAGHWILEMPELDGLSRRDINRVKSFIPARKDVARLSYGRFATKRPRQFVLFGTTNESRYLTDTTGNRRFWIVRAKAADPTGIAAARDQLWAEAAEREADENLWLDDPALRNAAAGVAHEASDFGPWLEILRERIPEGPLKIKATDAWKLVGFDGPETINKLTKAHHAHMRAAMVGLGFEKKDKGIRFRDGERKTAYLRGDPDDAREWSPHSHAPAYGDDPF
ncbi:5S rRNA maturation endonuclease (ribonuclease M5) [Rhizobium sp. BK650]|uniref:VapE domain-containing protein n=1 Tax=Rhizobium sp. BK650 TaxID=2586990 RepID=UPI00161935FD|nr:VapE domain-containing protein [Rhizobium sp. BK650]MBB3656118.1 5S rRNA maturation endonuclease (ribonuclease M5) [Rhizobium sp. BK650]